MNTSVCKNCIHYIRHYIVDKKHYAAINCGHCVYPMLKTRKPNTAACKNFVLREEPLSLPDRNETLHFLTKEVLEYIMSLELPPERE